ncbi:hypothetical protein [uncultured Cellulomonas sp.]|uniref:cupredoxin domain-containing protein n=1 Tax=uncultured Cellulomonas sp. TaxID=189682 RepID=UPI002629D436|nr:hypothetical protein [uncultured Cellulomonas sp.]
MRKQSLGVVLASLALLTACSGEPEEIAGEVEESVEAAVPTDEEAATDEETPTADASEPATAGTGEATVLLAMVGTEADPEAFEISLTTEDGEPVTSLPAGDYTIQVTDPAAMHNFHLTGGGVDESTSVPEVEDVTWDVTLEEGEYTYTCDPHPPMTGTFEVTA